MDILARIQTENHFLLEFCNHHSITYYLFKIVALLSFIVQCFHEV